MIFAIDKKITAAVFILAAALIFSAIPVGAAEPKRAVISREDYADALNAAFDRERERFGGGSLCLGYVEEGTAGESKADWYVIAQAAAGIDDDYGAYAKAAAEKLEERLKDPYGNYLTELARTAVALGFCGEKAPDLSGLDISQAGDNEVIWLAVAQRVNGYEYARFTEELSLRQAEDGGFGLADSDPDITAMALLVLPKDSNEARAALGFLKKYYAENGAEASCETSAQLIMGLCSQGIDPSGSADFTDENGIRPIDVLLSKRTDGGFTHLNEDEPNDMASMQAAAALAALGYYGARGRSAFEYGFEPADVFSLENPAGEAFDDYDTKTLADIKDPRGCDRDELRALKERAETYGAEKEVCGEIAEKLAESERICGEIERLNSRIRSGFYPPESAGLGDLGELKEINREISGYSEEDKALILSADGLIERQRELELRIIFITAFFCAAVAAAVMVIIYIKRKRKHEQ